MKKFGALIQLTILMLAFQRCAWAADEVSFARELLAILLPLSLVVAALIATLLVLHKRSSIGKSSGPLTVVQVLGVGPRERVVVLRDSNRSFAIGVAGGSVRFLTEVGSSAEDSVSDS